MANKVITPTGHIIGSITWDPTGYRFIPFTDARKPSRKGHNTPAEALPKWARRMGYRIDPTVCPVCQDAACEIKSQDCGK